MGGMVSLRSSSVSLRVVAQQQMVSLRSSSVSLRVVAQQQIANGAHETDLRPKQVVLPQTSLPLHPHQEPLQPPRVSLQLQREFSTLECFRCRTCYDDCFLCRVRRLQSCTNDKHLCGL